MITCRKCKKRYQETEPNTKMHVDDKSNYYFGSICPHCGHLNTVHVGKDEDGNEIKMVY